MATVTLEQALQAAVAHRQAGRLAAAQTIYRQIVAAAPQHAESWHQLGAIALAAGQAAEARDLLARAITLVPGNAEYHSDLGAALWMLGRAEEAGACFRRAIELQPGMAQAHCNLGVTLAELGRLDEALASYERARQLQPDYAEAHNNLGTVLSRKGRWTDAIASFRRALELKPGYAEAHTNLGGALLEIGDVDEAIAHCRSALSIQPRFAEAHASLGAALLRRGCFDEAIQSYRQAIACRADYATAHWKLAFILLLTGRYEEGWRELEWRWWSPALAYSRSAFSAPRWDGTPAPGQTILLHSEQGYGDAIHFLRYVPLVRARSGAERIILVCAKPLGRLIEQSGGCDAEIIACERWDEVALPAFHQHLPILSLPLALGLFDPLPAPHPYLHADPAARAAWCERLRPGFRVGLAWAGSRTHEDDRRRSIPPAKLAPLLRVEGVSIYSLQVETPGLPDSGNPGITDLTSHITDFADAAALVAELDLVITVDTATAHLAGALGRPVWLLLAHVPDWRWGLERENTPWYPTMRLFRQRAAGDWDEVVQRVAAGLEATR